MTRTRAVFTSVFLFARKRSWDQHFKVSYKLNFSGQLADVRTDHLLEGGGLVQMGGGGGVILFHAASKGRATKNDVRSLWRVKM